MKKTAAIDGSGLFDERTLVAFPLEGKVSAQPTDEV